MMTIAIKILQKRTFVKKYRNVVFAFCGQLWECIETKLLPQVVNQAS